MELSPRSPNLQLLTRPFQILLTVFLICCTSCVPVESFAQNYQAFLSLQKPFRYKDIRYYKGDDIEVKVKGQKGTLKGRVAAFTDTSITVNRETYSFGQLRSVVRRPDVRSDGVVVKASKWLPIVGLGYLTLSFVNGIVVKEYEFGVTKSAVKVAAVGVGSGLALWPFRTRRHRIDGRWRLRMMDLRPLQP